jgi:hypothetical protein
MKQFNGLRAKFAIAAALSGLAWFIASAPTASAQFVQNPAGKVGGGGVLNPIFNPNPNPNPIIPNPGPTNNAGGGGFIGFPWGGIYDFNPYGGMLQGSASVINAQGNFMVSREQAAILREKARQERVKTRRDIFDQWKYERENTPTVEDERIRMIKMDLARSLNNPPETEIFSGKSLNDILAGIQLTSMPQGVQSRKLTSEVLKQINLTQEGGNYGANVGILRNEGKLTWPVAFASLKPAEETKCITDRISSITEAAYGQALAGTVDRGILKELNSQIKALEDRLSTGIAAGMGDVTSGQILEAKRYIDALKSAARVLERPDAGEYLNGRKTAQGGDIAALVRHMTDLGLRFAPATRGGEGAYRTLHQGLVEYYNNIMQYTPPAGNER